MSWRRKSYEALPALTVGGPELRRSLRIVTAAWMLGVIWMACIGGSRMNIFARMLGFGEFHFGLLTALTFVATLAQLAATVFIERSGLTKSQFLSCATISRLTWVAIAAVPLVLPMPSPAAIWTVLGLLLLSSVMNALAQPAWMTWMGDLIPRRIRGRYFANRSIISQAVKVPVVISLAVLLDRVTRADPVTGQMLAMTPQSQPTVLWFVAAVFAAAGIVGTIDILLFHRVREVAGTTPDRPRPPAVKVPVSDLAGAGPAGRAARYLSAGVRELLFDPLRNRVFRRYVIYGATITFALAVGGSYFWRNSLENLRLSVLGTDMLFLVLGPLVGMLASRPWGRLIDRWGRRPVLILATAFTVLSITPYFYCTRHTPAPPFVIDAVNWVASGVGALLGRGDMKWLTPAMPVGAWLVMSLSMLFGGIGWCGVMLAQGNIVLGFTDGRGRSKYVAAHAVLIATGGILGGLAGGWVAELARGLQGAPICFGPTDAAGRTVIFAWNNWHLTFALSLAARITALLLLINMPDPGARRARDLFRHMRQNVYNSFTGLFYWLRVFGWGRSGRNDADRREP